jgi:hypothetical protein
VLSKLTMVFSRILVLFFLLNTMGCSASYLRATVKDNPLDVVASEAETDWSVDWIDQHTLRLTKSHVLASILMFGYCASHATLFYDASASELKMQYYLQGNYLMTLWMPARTDAELGPEPSELKLALNHEIDDILRWSGASVTERRVVKKSEPFPLTAPLFIKPKLLSGNTVRRIEGMAQVFNDLSNPLSLFL